jgi:hypothetical protein
VKTVFNAKTWIYWAQGLLCTLFGVGSCIIGVGILSGAIESSNGSNDRSVGAYPLAIGLLLLLVGALGLVNALGRRRPVLRCFREGVECNLVGATTLDAVPLVPGYFRVAWAILSGQGFRSNIVRIPWPAFRSADVGGSSLMQVLHLQAAATNTRTGQTVQSLTFKQLAFKDDLDTVEASLTRLSKDPQAQAELPPWPAAPALRP